MMKRILFIAVLTTAVFTACAGNVLGENHPNRGDKINGRKPVTVYMDSNLGNDKNDGRSAKRPVRSLKRLNEFIFGPGDKILFKAGSRFDGQFVPQGSGSAERPVTVSVYGKGPRPQINGNGSKEYAVHLHNVEYWDISGLEITNKGTGPKVKRRGLVITAENCGELHGIRIADLIIRDVNGGLEKKKGAGGAILVQVRGTSMKSRFNGLLIENCWLHHCERNGINFTGSTQRNESWYPNLGVIIRGNLLEHIPGDGIVPIACDGAIIEENVMRYSPDVMSRAEAAAGIWPWSSDNTVIRYNEVYEHNAKWDGQGFDADFNCRNTLFEYNYSHDNAGGFMLVCCKGSTYGTESNIGTSDVTIRNNVSFNDGLRKYETRQSFFSPIFHITGPVNHVQIHQNIIICPSKSAPEIDDRIIKMNNWDGPWPTGVNISGNHFFLSGSFKNELGPVAPESIGENEVHEHMDDSELTEELGGKLLETILEKTAPTKSRWMR